MYLKLNLDVATLPLQKYYFIHGSRCRNIGRQRTYTSEWCAVDKVRIGIFYIVLNVPVTTFRK